MRDYIERSTVTGEPGRITGSDGGAGEVVLFMSAAGEDDGPREATERDLEWVGEGREKQHSGGGLGGWCAQGE